MFNARRFHERLTTHDIGRFLVYRTVTESTMILARAEAEQGAPHGTLVLAEEQTAGRGRRGRAFFSPAGDNLYFTLILRLPIELHKRLPIAVAVAVCRAIREEGIDARIKWPNDVWLRDRKLSGMLIDAEMGPSGPIAFPGIGINVNGDPTENPELQETASSLRLELDRVVDREILLARICDDLEASLHISREDLAEHYRDLSMILGRRVLVHPTREEPWTGEAIRITDSGELVVARDDGREETVTAADVSVRPA